MKVVPVGNCWAVAHNGTVVAGAFRTEAEARMAAGSLPRGRKASYPKKPPGTRLEMVLSGRVV